MFFACVMLIYGQLCPTTATVKDEIEKQAMTYGVDASVALRIGKCESQFIYNAKNPNSSARGIMQFTDGTWEWTGGGDRLNYMENINRFMRCYKKYPSYWECK